MTINTRTAKTTITTNFEEKNDNSFKTLIPTLIPSSSPTWKLYENPSYTFQQNHKQNKQQKQDQDQENKQLHLLHLPVSTRKIASSFWDLTFIKPFMDSDLETAQAQIMELKAQLEYERKARKKAESLTKKLMKDVVEERKETKALEKVCEELAVELTAHKSEISRLKMGVAEVLREERVHMKLSDAKILLEEKISELESTKMIHMSYDNDHEKREPIYHSVISRNSSHNPQGKKVSLEPENPHIKHGIRGFVEFPRVVKVIGSKSRHMGTKLECQKAQLMILLKQTEDTNAVQ